MWYISVVLHKGMLYVSEVVYISEVVQVKWLAGSAQCEMCCERPGACASVNGTSFCQPCPPGAFNK